MIYEAEVHTSDGRIDAVVQTDEIVYVLEFKLDESAEIAVQQMKEKAYSDKYQGLDKEIRGLGINFSSQTKSVDDWQKINFQLMSTRRLAAIMFTDIVGYTAMMQRDKATSMAKVSNFRSTMAQQVEKHHGELLEIRGDGSLSVFSSATDAVSCAKEIQESLLEDVPLRIGIHLGDIIHKEKDIFGDAVNIASRIESMGVAGAILVSSNVRNQIKNKPEFELASLGRFAFKNVEEDMNVYALANEGLIVPDIQSMKGKGHKVLDESSNTNSYKTLIRAMTFSFIGILLGAFIWMGISWVGQVDKKTNEISEEPSIAVLPFTNLSNDSSQVFFSDGITEDILINLAKIKDLKVIARSSSFSFKGQNLPVSEIAKQLNVDHILEGSVRKLGKQLRISTQLVHAESGEMVWAENFNRDIEDVFLLQEEVAREIAKTLSIQLSVEEDKALNRATKVHPMAYEYCLEAKQLLKAFDLQYYHKARDLALEAIKLDSSFVEAYIILGSYYINRGIWVGDLSAQEARELSSPYLEKARTLNPTFPDLYIVTGQSELWLHWNFQKAAENIEAGFGSYSSGMAPLLYIYLGEFEKAQSFLNKIKETNPFSPDIPELEVVIHYYQDSTQLAIQAAQKAIRLSPERANSYKFLANIYRNEGKPEEAINLLETRMKSMGVRPPYFLAELATSFYSNGQKSEALSLIKELEDSYNRGRSGSPAYFLSMTYANLGDETEAFEWLERSYELREVEMVWLKMDPLAKPLRSNPKYEELMKKVGFPTQ